jgi:phage gp46-like protein
MIRSLACVITLSILLCVTHAVCAQMKSDPTRTWRGAMTTEVATTGLEFTLSRDAKSWKATIKARQPSGQEIDWPVQDLQITDANISFAAERPRNLVKVAGKFAGDKLSGAVERFENGQ